jgi:DNA polymerase-1
LAVQPKRKSVIKKGVNFSYDKATFAQHKYENFYETDRAEDVLALIKPFEFLGRKFICLDTEDYPTALKNHEIPKGMVRRWIGTGKKAKPVDLPFCMSFCDGVNAITLYDSLANGYKEIKKMAVLLEDPTIEKIFHNTKFDMHMLANIKIKMRGKLHDTTPMAKITNENRPDFTLWGLAERRKWGIVKFEYMVDAYKDTHKVTDYRMIPRELMTQYANADVMNLFNLFMEEYQILIAEDLVGIYEQELEVMLACWVMERVGMQSDPNYEKPLKQELRQLTDDAEAAVYAEAGVFNMNSGKQVFTVLIKLGVDPKLIKINPDTGNPILDKYELEKLGEVHGIPIVKKMLDYKKFEKLLGTYAEGIYDQRDSLGKVHSNINQTEATTGRMSITKPALQTLPKKDKRIRKIFVPTSDEYELWFMDLDQIEYRIFAHYAKAKGLIEAIKAGHDVHAATAAILYNKPIEEVTEEERGRGKTINFSLLYGQGNEASMNSLKMSMAETIRFKRHYFAMMPEMEPFIQSVHAVIQARGFVRNLFGRRRRLKKEEAYKAPNALIQGCAADYIKNKMTLMYRYLLAYKFKTRLINIVHDELIPEVHKSERHIVPKLRWLLSDFENFRCPITAGAERGGPSWGEKVTVEDVGFEPLTEEEMSKTKEVDVWDGSVFDLVA